MGRKVGTMEDRRVTGVRIWFYYKGQRAELINGELVKDEDGVGTD